MYQHPRYLPHATVKAMIEVAMRIKQVEIFPSLMLKALLPEVSLTQAMHTLSRGQITRFSLLIALLAEPKMILLDEPLAGLDADNKIIVLQHIKQAMKQSMVVIATHEPQLFEDVHPHKISFPLPQSSQLLPPAKPYQQFPITARAFMSKLWMIRYHLHHANKNKRQKMMMIAPTLSLVFLKLIVVVIGLLHQQVMDLTASMLGGHYAYVYTSELQETSLQSVIADDDFFSFFPDPMVHRYSYDVQFFDSYFPQTMYVAPQGLKHPLPEMTLQLVNTYHLLALEAPAPQRYAQLNPHEMILGIQMHHIRMLAQVFRIFPTLVSLRQYVTTYRPLVMFDLVQADWGYVNHIGFEWVDVLLTDSPGLYHSHPNYAYEVIETMMRFPSRAFEEDEFPPWYVARTMSVRPQDKEVFLHLFFIDKRYAHYHLIPLNAFRFQVLKSIHPMGLQASPLPASSLYLPHHHLYGFFPEHLLSGFLIPTAWSSQPSLLDTYALLLEGEPLDYYLQQFPEKGILRGHLALPGPQSVRLHPTTQSMAVDEVGISSALAKQLNLHIGDQLLGWIDVHHQSMIMSVKVVSIMEQTQLFIYQRPGWFEAHALSSGFVSTLDMIPKGYAIFDEVSHMPKGYQMVEPFKEMEQRTQDILTLLWYVLAGLAIGLLLPSLTMFQMHLQSYYVLERPIYQTFYHLGASQEDVREWMSTFAHITVIKMFIASFLTFFLVDFSLQVRLAQYFYTPFVYQFPWQSLFVASIISAKMIFFVFGWKNKFDNNL
jgi:hypothetical protein